MRNGIFIVAIIFIVCLRVCAQSKFEIAHSKKLYEGTWVNKKDKRYIAFFFEKQINYVTVNDWIGTSNRNIAENIDAYRAYIKGDKLILLSENNDHHAVYCEIEIVNHKLIYQCNTGLNFKDNFLVKTEGVHKVVFVRLRE